MLAVPAEDPHFAGVTQLVEVVLRNQGLGYSEKPVSVNYQRQGDPQPARLLHYSVEAVEGSQPVNAAVEAIERGLRRLGAGLEEVVGAQVGVLPGPGIGTGKPPVIEPRTVTSNPAAVAVTEAGAPAGVVPPTSGARGTFDFADLRIKINLLPQLQLTNSATISQAVFGVIAGPEDIRGLATGIALSRRAFGPNGEPVPVIFIVKDQAQAEALQALGVSIEQILIVGSSEKYRTVDATANEASELLRGLWNVTSVVELGVYKPVSPLLLEILENLFGIKLDNSPAIKAWQEAIDQADVELRAA